MVHACGVLVASVVSMRAASAQTGWMVGARVAIAEYRIDAGFGVERFSGWGLGLEGSRALSPRLGVSIVAQGVQLPADAAGDLDRRMGDLDARAHYRVAPWWGLYGGVTLRAVASDAARQHWLITRIGAEFRPAFSGGNARAIGRLGIIPVATVSGLSASSLGFDGAVGVDYSRGAVTIAVLYGLERFGFPALAGVRRSEQVSTLIVRGEIGVGRRRP